MNMLPLLMLPRLLELFCFIFADICRRRFRRFSPPRRLPPRYFATMPYCRHAIDCSPLMR